MKKKSIGALLSAAICGVLFCSSICLSAENYPYRKGNLLYFMGEGKADQTTENQTQKRSMAKEASILDGKAKIALYIENLKTKKGESIRELLKKDNKIQMKVRAYLTGVETVESSWDEQDNCKTILKINRKQILRQLKAKE